MPYMTPAGTWAFSIGTSIGWGSFVVTCSSYLGQAGILGTVLGLLLGMAATLIISNNLCYMMERNPNAGGIYSYGKKIRGHDTGFLIAWFLLLTYLAVLWANITSLPLFARIFIGPLFEFSYCYNVFGYNVYLGEALLSIGALVIVSWLCSRSRKLPQYIMIIMAILFLASVLICTLVALVGHGDTSFSFDPVYLPDKSQLGQVVRIAVISPWAFIGFENVSHFTEEFSYPLKKIRSVMLASVVLTTLFYVLMTLLSTTAYPERYGSWLEYISNMNQLTGLEAIPAFYAAFHYMGQTGVYILMLALLAVVITSLIGNLTAISRLLYAFGRDHGWTGELSKLNKYHIPGRAIFYTVLISSFIPFLGRTAIGWIVDITTLGATIIYGFLSDFVYKDAQIRGDRRDMAYGFVGILLMLLFGALLLTPRILSYEAMAGESYLLFTFWALLGIMVFHLVVVKDTRNEYGHSIIVWVVLLLLMIMTTMMWVNRQTQEVTSNSMEQIGQFYRWHFEQGVSPDKSSAYFLGQVREQIDAVNTRATVTSFLIFTFAIIVMLNNFRTDQKISNRLRSELGLAQRISNRDPLTGVKNKHAYEQWEKKFDLEIEEELIEPFAVVVCDINNMKMINDNFGHQAGDECIRQACAHICKTFAHSPVFRYGGDEFVVLLYGEDYEKRGELLKNIPLFPSKELKLDGVSLAAGMVEFDKEKHSSLSSVFVDADKAMYEIKRAMKAVRRNES